MSSRSTRLYHRLQLAARATKRVADRQMLEATGLTTAQVAALAVVSDHPAASQRVIAARLGVQESAVTAMVGRLVHVGAVSRQRDPADARRWVVSLTAHGTSVLARAEVSFSRTNGAIESVLAEHDIDELAVLLERLIGLPDDRGLVGT